MISLSLNSKQQSKAFELLLTYINLSLTSFSALSKDKSLSFLNLGLFLHEMSIAWLEHLYILSQTSETGLEAARTLVQSWHFQLESF